MKRIVTLALLLAPKAIAYDLLEVLTLSQNNDPGYHAEVLKLNASELSEKIATGKLSPSLSTSITGLNTLANNNTTTTSSTIKLTAAVPLFNPKALYGYKKGKIGTSLAHTGLRSYKTSHTLGIVDSYFQTLIAQAAYNSQLMAYQQYQKSYESALEMEKAGIKSHVDTLVSQSALDLSQLNLVEAENTLSQSLNSLEGKVDTPVTHLNSYQGMDIPDLPTPSQTDLLDHALTKGARIQKAFLDFRLKQEELHAATAENFTPTVSLGVEASQSIGDFVKHGPFDQENSNLSTSLTASVSLFSGFSDYYTVKQAHLNYQAAENELQNEQYAVKLAIEKSYHDFISAKHRVSASLSAMQSSQASLEALREQNLAGDATELDLMQAITQSQQAQEKYYSAVYGYLGSYLSLKGSASLLTQDDLKIVNRHLPKQIALLESPDLS